MTKFEILDCDPAFREANHGFRFTVGVRHETTGVVLCVGQKPRPAASLVTRDGLPYVSVWADGLSADPTHSIRLVTHRVTTTDYDRELAALRRVTPTVHTHAQCPIGQVADAGTVAGTVRCHELWRGPETFVGFRFDLRLDELTEGEAKAVAELLRTMRAKRT